MLKTEKNNKMWLVTQPDHAEAAGYLAAHWGNERFAKPGYFAPVADPEQLRSEFVWAVGQHDNGWWEWDALAEQDPVSGFPKGLREVLKNQHEGMQRWRLGLNRFEGKHFAKLMISLHAYWLYAARLEDHRNQDFNHSLFWKTDPETLMQGSEGQVQSFVLELKKQQMVWLDELAQQPELAAWAESANVNPHARLLQLLDGLSLSLTSKLIPSESGQSLGLGQDRFELHDVPRKSWDDRVTINVNPISTSQVQLDPYPFDIDPLPVSIVARVFDLPFQADSDFQTWWYAQQQQMLQYEYVSG